MEAEPNVPHLIAIVVVVVIVVVVLIVIVLGGGAERAPVRLIVVI